MNKSLLINYTREKSKALLISLAFIFCIAAYPVSVLALIVEEAVEMITGAQHPMKIGLHYNQIGDEGAKAIAGAIIEAQHPMAIDISHNKIGPKGAKEIADAIAKTKHSMVIDISENKIGPDGAKAIADAIANAKHPMTMGLSYNKIGPEGAKLLAGAIVKAEYSMEIDISNNNIGPEGAKAIADAIAKAKYSMMIDISCNNIGSKGAIAIADAIIKAKHPIAINVSYNNIRLDGAKAIAEALANRFFLKHHVVLSGDVSFYDLCTNARKEVGDDLLNASLGLKNSPFPDDIVYEILTNVGTFLTKDEQTKLQKFQGNYLNTIIEKVKNPRTIGGWRLHDVPGDGNCFYRAVAHQVETFFPEQLIQLNLQTGTELHDVLCPASIIFAGWRQLRLPVS